MTLLSYPSITVSLLPMLFPNQLDFIFSMIHSFRWFLLLFFVLFMFSIISAKFEDYEGNQDNRKRNRHYLSNETEGDVLATDLKLCRDVNVID